MKIKDKLVSAIVDGLQDKKGKGIVVVDLTGLEDAEVIVHIMMEEERAFYDIEHLWEDAAIESIPDLD